MADAIDSVPVVGKWYARLGFWMFLLTFGLFVFVALTLYRAARNPMVPDSSGAVANATFFARLKYHAMHPFGA